MQHGAADETGSEDRRENGKSLSCYLILSICPLNDYLGRNGTRVPTS